MERALIQFLKSVFRRCLFGHKHGLECVGMSQSGKKWSDVNLYFPLKSSLGFDLTMHLVYKPFSVMFSIYLREFLVTNIHLELLDMYLPYLSYSLFFPRSMKYWKIWMNSLFLTTVSHPKTCMLSFRSKNQIFLYLTNEKWTPPKKNQNSKGQKNLTIKSKQPEDETIINHNDTQGLATPDSEYLAKKKIVLVQTLSLFVHPSGMEAVKRKTMWHGKGKFQQHMLNTHVIYRSAGCSCEV